MDSVIETRHAAARARRPGGRRVVVAQGGTVDRAVRRLRRRYRRVPHCPGRDRARHLTGDTRSPTTKAVQHHYGELIIAYYTSGFSGPESYSISTISISTAACSTSSSVTLSASDADRSLRHPSHAVRADRHRRDRRRPAATARHDRRPRAGIVRRHRASAVSGVWYGGMFNHTKDIPFAAAMMGATLFLMRFARSLPVAARRRRPLVRGAGSARRSACGCLGLLLRRLCRLRDRALSRRDRGSPKGAGGAA